MDDRRDWPQLLLRENGSTIMYVQAMNEMDEDGDGDIDFAEFSRFAEPLDLPGYELHLIVCTAAKIAPAKGIGAVLSAIFECLLECAVGGPVKKFTQYRGFRCAQFMSYPATRAHALHARHANRHTTHGAITRIWGERGWQLQLGKKKVLKVIFVKIHLRLRRKV